MENLLWIEKYRPLKFNNILGQDKIIKILEKMIENGSFPHLILSGSSGTGKTSTIMAIVEKLYGKSKTFMVMKLDASDDRGINSVRDEIKGFAEKITLFNKGIKLIILDEADAMTFDAQFALRRIVEKYSDTTRFCFICNYENKIIPPIKSRCLNFTFFPVDKDNIIKKLKYICKKEKIRYDNDAIEVIAKLSNGDFRKSINLLQSISMRIDVIKKQYCYETVGLLNDNTLKNILELLLNKNINIENKYIFIKKELIDTGISLSLFLGQLSSIILENTTNISIDKLTDYLIKLSKLEYAVSSSTFGNLYIKTLISIFI